MHENLSKTGILAPPFLGLVIIQFVVTLTGAATRMLAIFFLNDILGASDLTRILFMTTISIVGPLLLFNMLGGELADRFNKGDVLRLLQLFVVLGLGILFLSFILKSEWLVYTGLFCLAFQAALFAPVRLSIIPEIVSEGQIPWANSIVTTINYTSLLLGAFFASYLTIRLDRDFLSIISGLLILVSLFSLAVLWIRSNKNGEKKPISWNFVEQTYVYLKLSHTVPYLLLVIVYGAYFLLACLFTQLNLIPFGYENLGISDAESGYLLLYSSLGLGIGSFFYGLVSKKNIEVSFALIGGLGTAISYLGMVIFAEEIFAIEILSFLIGVFGGFFIVPLNGYLQTKSPESMRGSIIAASNMVGYIFLLLGATFLKLSMDLFYFTATQNFIFLFVVTFGMWSIFAFAFRYSLLRPILLITLGLFFRVKVSQSYRGVYRASNLNWIHRIAFMSVFEPLIFVKKCEKLPSWWCRVWGQLFSIIYILDEQNKIFQTIKATTLQIDGLIVLENDTRKEVPQLAIERRKGVFDFVISLQG